MDETKRKPVASYRIHDGVAEHPADLIAEREPCECPVCGSAASHAVVEMLVRLDGHDDCFAQCSLTVPDPERVSSDDDCVPVVTQLLCDDCGTEFAPGKRLFAELRIVTCIG